jgi:hypothetical protein
MQVVILKNYNQQTVFHRTDNKPPQILDYPLQMTH